MLWGNATKSASFPRRRLCSIWPMFERHWESKNTCIPKMNTPHSDHFLNWRPIILMYWLSIWWHAKNLTFSSLNELFCSRFLRPSASTYCVLIIVIAVTVCACEKVCVVERIVHAAASSHRWVIELIGQPVLSSGCCSTLIILVELLDTCVITTGKLLKRVIIWEAAQTIITRPST